MNLMRALSFATLSCLLAACSTDPQGVRVINGDKGPIPGKQVEAVKILQPTEVQVLVAGKTFQYTRKNSSGFVVYNADGTLAVKDDKAGSSSGRWGFQNGQYCETYSATQTAECGTFRSTGDAYFAANSRLVDLRI